LFGQVLAHRDDNRKIALTVADRNQVRIEIKSANHFFDDHEEQLTSAIGSWLNENDVTFKLVLLCTIKIINLKKQTRKQKAYVLNSFPTIKL